jgi:predicted flap endonuclease-1-like 5' DNA nuclease
MEQNKKSYLFLWLGLLVGIISSFLYFLFNLRENKKDLSNAFVNKYINIDPEESKPKLIEKPSTKKTVKETQKDDLTLIKGIGPAIEKLLNENNVFSFKDLSLKNTDDLKAILSKKNFRLADPSKWVAQANQLKK